MHTTCSTEGYTLRTTIKGSPTLGDMDALEQSIRDWVAETTQHVLVAEPRHVG